MVESYVISNAICVGISYPTKGQYGIQRTYHFEYFSNAISDNGRATKTITKTDDRMKKLYKYEASGFKEGEEIVKGGIYDLRFTKSKFNDKMDLQTIYNKNVDTPHFIKEREEHQF